MEMVVLSTISTVMLLMAVAFSVSTVRIISPIRLLTQAAQHLWEGAGTCFQQLPVRSEDEMSHKQQFDIILMEVQLPEMVGLEAPSLIRKSEQSKGKHTPIVAMTAHAIVGDRERCLSAGMDGYVSGPSDYLVGDGARSRPPQWK
jgi:CheY-like chemotaxis protein